VADFRRSRGFGDAGGESLDAIARTDQLLDALATERRIPPVDAGDAELFALLGAWRDEVRWPPATDLVSERDAAAALRDGLNTMPARRGGHRGLTIVTSLAAAVLCIGGFGAVVSGAGPGDPLYGLRTTLLGEPQQVRDDNVALAAKSEMEQVQTLIDNGQWEQAQQKLATVSDSVQTVDDTSTKQQLIDQWNQLAVKVDQQDPAATVPPSAAPGPLEQLTLPSLPESVPPLPETVPSIPGFSLPETIPPLPSGLPSLPETMPSIPDFSLPESIPSFTLPSMTLPPSLFPPPGSASAVPEPQQTVGAPPPVVTTTSTPTPTPTASTPTSTSSAPTSESSATSTTQSQAPPVVTTTTTPTAAAPASTPAPSSAVTTTAAAAAPRAAESQTAVAPAAPTVAQTAPQRAPDVVTTTMPRPVLPLPVLGGN
jgi:hypothetical protein